MLTLPAGEQESDRVMAKKAAEGSAPDVEEDLGNDVAGQSAGVRPKVNGAEGECAAAGDGREERATAVLVVVEVARWAHAERADIGGQRTVVRPGVDAAEGGCAAAGPA